MDLFSQVDDPQSDEELADWVNSAGLDVPFPDECPDEQPLTPRQKAFIYGQEAAGVPSWSNSVKIIQRRLDAILERLTADEQPAVVQAFEDGQAAYRERRAAEMAMDLEEIP